ncbi:hypothetical protein [Bifidobacterium xylocopae]|uniref:Uncharacterized protein n=1 Tax=Bifidobacterium xylocopae TaxID=2493119 RepID=A0A366KG34_9BIFI|nr:hypothetical protein [Bifidobacterium xylocopae]RBQ00054.1 hypothetical protein CRD59_00910 [Bifidobacterium xylocopae]
MKRETVTCTAYELPGWLRRYAEWRHYKRWTITKDKKQDDTSQAEAVTEGTTRETVEIPDSAEELRYKERERTRDLLTDKWRDRICPVCGGRDFQAGDTMVLRDRSYTSFMPVCQVICLACGHTMLFNALVLGVKTAQDYTARRMDGDRV